MLAVHKDILLLSEQVENKLNKQDQKIELLFTYLNKFIEKDIIPRTPIGFKTKKGK